jgi:hypothetical protein
MIGARITARGRRAPARRKPQRRAADVLGREHPVARASRWRDILVDQAVGASCLLAIATAVAVARHTPSAIAFASCAFVVETWVLAGAGFATTLLRGRARDVIADGDDGSEIVEITIERQRLVHHRTRVRLAQSLERALYEAEHWHEIPISTRPPQGVAQLATRGATVADVARLVRDPASGVRGIALLDRLLRDGYASPLYRGPERALDEELRRIRYLLS